MPSQAHSEALTQARTHRRTQTGADLHTDAQVGLTAHITCWSVASFLCCRATAQAVAVDLDPVQWILLAQVHTQLAGPRLPLFAAERLPRPLQ